MSDSTAAASTTTPEVKPTEATAAASTETAAAAPSAAAAESTPAASPAAPEEEKVEGADSTAEYQPVVHLQPVEVSTGEEQDEVIYKQRAACYRFDTESNSWKERGRGDVKILQNKESGMIRVLLRQEKTLKLCMNHKVHPEIELVPNAGSDRSWTWRTLDFSTDAAEGEKQTFALRFKDSETANEFKKHYDEAREKNAANDKDKADKKEGDKKEDKPAA